MTKCCLYLWNGTVLNESIGEKFCWRYKSEHLLIPWMWKWFVRLKRYYLFFVFLSGGLTMVFATLQVFKAIIRGQQQEDKVPNTVYLHTYLQYLKLTKTIQRNLLMIEGLKANLPGKRADDSRKLTKPQDLSRLYDIICQVMTRSICTVRKRTLSLKFANVHTM